MKLRSKLLAAMGGLMLAGVAAPAHAHSIILTLTNGPTADGSEFDYTYTVQLTAVNQVQTGNEFTLYDFQGFDASKGISTTGLSGWTASVDNNQTPPAGTAPLNDPTVPDITFTYSGPTIEANPTEITLGTFTATSIYGNHEVPDVNSPNYTGTDFDPSTGLVQANVGETDAPVVPVPAGVWGGLGLFGLLAGKRIKSRVLA